MAYSTGAGLYCQSYRSLFAIVEASETSNDPSSAAINPDTLNPSKKLAANQNNRAFSTNVNKPNVMMVIGSVKIKRIGRTMRLSNPSTIDAINAA